MSEGHTYEADSNDLDAFNRMGSVKRFSASLNGTNKPCIVEFGAVGIFKIVSFNEVFAHRSADHHGANHAQRCNPQGGFGGAGEFIQLLNCGNET